MQEGGKHGGLCIWSSLMCGMWAHSFMHPQAPCSTWHRCWRCVTFASIDFSSSISRVTGPSQPFHRPETKPVHTGQGLIHQPSQLTYVCVFSGADWWNLWSIGRTLAPLSTITHKLYVRWNVLDQHWGIRRLFLYNVKKHNNGEGDRGGRWCLPAASSSFFHSQKHWAGRFAMRGGGWIGICLSCN